MRRPYDFTWSTVQSAWGIARCFPGRNPKRWRVDALDWPVFQTMRSSFTGLTALQYDHIVAPMTDEEKLDPKFKDISNCQLLSAKVNAGKQNNKFSTEELIEKQFYLRPTSKFKPLHSL